MEKESDDAPKNEREHKVAAHARAKLLRELGGKDSFVGKQTRGFMNFIREQGVVSLAVGLALGTAATVLVKSIVDNMITPVIGAVLPGGSDLAGKYFCLTTGPNGECMNKISWGIVISNLITFFAMAAIIYFVVKGLKLDKLDKKKED